MEKAEVILKKIKEECGFDFSNYDELFYYVYNSIRWLEYNNKNYTKPQYFRIRDLNDIVNIIYKEM